MECSLGHGFPTLTIDLIESKLKMNVSYLYVYSLKISFVVSILQPSSWRISLSRVRRYPHLLPLSHQEINRKKPQFELQL
jgi:hypothetical protein